MPLFFGRLTVSGKVAPGWIQESKHSGASGNMKLLQLKKWLRISEAAQYLSMTCREEVKDTDVLQLVLNRELLLSAYLFESVDALQLKAGNVDFTDLPLDAPSETDLLPELRRLKGLVDLLPVHGGLDAIESIYRQHLGGSATPLQSFSGLLVRDQNDGIYQIQEPINRPIVPEAANELKQEDALYPHRNLVRFSRSYPEAESDAALLSDKAKSATASNWFQAIRSAFRPAPGLPADCLVCISMTNIQSFLTRISGSTDQRRDETIGDLERSSLLKMVLGMAISKYGYQPTALRNLATGENRGSINADLQRIGLSLDADTIRKFLTEANTRFGDDIFTNRNDQS